MVKWLKRIIFLILFVVALILGITFTSENSQTVSLIFFGYTLPELKLGFWIMAILFKGGLIGLLLSFVPSLFNKKTLAAKDRKIRQLEQEINQLRTSSLKG